MSRSLLYAASLVSALVLIASARAAEEEKELKADCPVSGKPAVQEHAVDYKGAKVYFCCPKCPPAFEKDTAKFAAKANHQLVVTGQATEVKCPLTGRPLNEETAIDVDGAKVAFCCNNCKGKAEKAKGDEQINLIFNDKAFDQGFKVAKKTAR
jgi:YHS domain-containing protein